MPIVSAEAITMLALVPAEQIHLCIEGKIHRAMHHRGAMPQQGSIDQPRWIQEACVQTRWFLFIAKLLITTVFLLKQ